MAHDHRETPRQTEPTQQLVNVAINAEKNEVTDISKLTPRMHSNKPTEVNREDLDIHTDNATFKFKTKARKACHEVVIA